jgi:hypothetical protein
VHCSGEPRWREITTGLTVSRIRGSISLCSISVQGFPGCFATCWPSWPSGHVETGLYVESSTARPPALRLSLSILCRRGSSDEKNKVRCM